jgi:hypothetical protein
VIGVVEVVDIFITYNHQLLQFSWVHELLGLDTSLPPLWGCASFKFTWLAVLECSAVKMVS